MKKKYLDLLELQIKALHELAAKSNLMEDQGFKQAMENLELFYDQAYGELPKGYADDIIDLIGSWMGKFIFKADESFVEPYVQLGMAQLYCKVISNFL